MNRRPSGPKPDALPSCATPRSLVRGALSKTGPQHLCQDASTAMDYTAAPRNCQETPALRSDSARRARSVAQLRSVRRHLVPEVRNGSFPVDGWFQSARIPVLRGPERIRRPRDLGAEDSAEGRMAQVGASGGPRAMLWYTSAAISRATCSMLAAFRAAGLRLRR